MPASVRLFSALALGLVIALVAVSSYIRLSHSGLGCEVWPQCYGHIGQPRNASTLMQADQPGPSVQQPGRWAQPVHRVLASTLGVIIIALLGLTWRTRQQWRSGRSSFVIAIILFALTLGLALLGVYSGHLHNRAIVMGNLSGGVLMLMLLGWLRLSGTVRPVPGVFKDRLRRLANLSLFLLLMQIGLGGLTGANFAATACTTFPDCQGQWLPNAQISKAMDLSQPVKVNSGGYAIGGSERQSIHLAHRTLAWILGISLLALALNLWRQGLRGSALVLTVLLGGELGVGITAIYMQLPIALAVAHNWLAGLIMLCILRIMALNRNLYLF